MSHGSTVLTSLTFQEKMAIFHALEAESGISCLSKRLQFAINKRDSSEEFAEEEIQSIVKALDSALKESQVVGAERYGYFSLAELRELLEKIEKLSQVFSAKGA